MKTFPFRRPDGVLTGFEIVNFLFPPAQIARLLQTIPEVTDVRKRRMFSRWEEIHVWFRYRGVECVVWEPFGDSSRLCIRPADTTGTPDIEGILQVFRAHQLWLPVRVLQDLVTLGPLWRLLGREET